MRILGSCTRRQRVLSAAGINKAPHRRHSESPVLADNTTICRPASPKLDPQASTKPRLGGHPGKVLHRQASIALSMQASNRSCSGRQLKTLPRQAAKKKKTVVAAVSYKTLLGISWGKIVQYHELIMTRPSATSQARILKRECSGVITRTRLLGRDLPRHSPLGYLLLNSIDKSWQ